MTLPTDFWQPWRATETGATAGSRTKKKGGLSAKYNPVQSSAAVLRLEWHTDCFSTTRSERVPMANSEYTDEGLTFC